MDDAVRESRSGRFDAVAESYARGRPPYPDRATRWLTDGMRSRVLELGAGTGQLTAALAGWGHEVVATDPSGPMLEQMPADLGVDVVRTPAEHLPFASSSFDVVVAAQAFHWFDPGLALPEIARVLRPDGLLSVVWNRLDESIPWVRRLMAAIRPADAEPRGDDHRAYLTSELFTDHRSAVFGHWQQIDLPGLLALVASRSYVAERTADDRAGIEEQVRELYAEHVRGTGGLRLRYRTECDRATVVRSALPAPETAPGDDGGLLVDFR
ncbi:class I SAM-dependent methyltransferase [Solicola sp. PLA-1-18]|uniref:class I SAM-dependent methyltransferase n=1 Tax=Solicola sp. PLA-1-18 TaxID=3380532 RepID=UPI003B7FDD0B